MISDSWLARLSRRVRYLVRRADAEREMDHEMRLHLELEIEERVRNGMTPDEARRTARVDFGGVENHKEAARSARGVRPIEDLAQDAGYAFRVLRKSPGFTTASILTVAIGVAATTVVFSAADTLLLRPLPVLEPHRLFALAETWRDGGKSGSTSMGYYQYPYRHYLALREATHGVFNGLAGFRYGNAALRVGDDARPLTGIVATTNYFHVLGLQPALGRLFSDTTERFGAAPEIVISYDFWRSDLAGDSTVLGRTLFVDSRPVTIVGVAPRGFNGTITGLLADVWMPATMDARPTAGSAGGDPVDRLGPVIMFGRLEPGMDVGRAERELAVIGPRVDADEPAKRVKRIDLDPLTGLPAMARGGVLGFTAMLMMTAVLVLLIAAANIAGMLLARGAHRRPEIAVRLALGASRGRLVRQLVTESVLLCLAGGASGVLLARWLVSLLPTINLPIGPRTQLDLRVDATVLGASFGVAVVAGLVAGLTPALQSTRFDILTGLRRGAGQGASARKSRTRSRFVVAQLAMALVLLITAGLFTRALERALAVDPGLDVSGVVVAEVSVESHAYDRARGQAFYKQLVERLHARPELTAAALGEWTPLAMSHNGEGVKTPDGKFVPVTYGLADEGYFTAMRIPLVAGRGFGPEHVFGTTPVTIVNETLARRMWPGQSPIGQHIKLNGDREVIGVVRDGKYRNLDERPTAYAFLPFAQRYSPRMSIFARARGGDVASALSALRQEVKALDPNIALEKEGLLANQIEIYSLPQRAAAWFVGAFGLVGLVLAALGIYGVISYHVAQRTRELGIRLALGAGHRDVVMMVLRQGLEVIASGLGLGVVLALGVGRLASGFLFGVSGADPVTFVVVPATLGLVALVASYVPARRAARVDPMRSLRVD